MTQNMNAADQRQIFEEWLQDHTGLFFKIVRAYAFTTHDQEDLFQEIATQVWNSIPSFRGDCAVTTWIYRVALYSAMGWSKKERRHRDSQQTVIEQHLPVLQPPKESNPRLDWLYDQIARLEEIDRCLTLLMLDGFSYREISATLGISETHVGVKLNRIKQRLTAESTEVMNNGV